MVAKPGEAPAVNKFRAALSKGRFSKTFRIDFRLCSKKELAKILSVVTGTTYDEDSAEFTDFLLRRPEAVKTVAEYVKLNLLQIDAIKAHIELAVRISLVTGASLAPTLFVPHHAKSALAAGNTTCAINQFLVEAFPKVECAGWANLFYSGAAAVPMPQAAPAVHEAAFFFPCLDATGVNLIDTAKQEVLTA